MHRYDPNNPKYVRPNIFTTYSGLYFDYANPTPDMIDIRDIAIGLSRQYRFNGHTPVPYTIAQHSVIVSKNVEDTHTKAALLHDGAESYVRDMVSPMKMLLPDYKNIETNIQKAIALKFDIPYEDMCSDIVKYADMRALNTEKSDILGNCDNWGIGQYPVFDEVIIPMTSEQALSAFLMRSYELGLTN